MVGLGVVWDFTWTMAYYHKRMAIYDNIKCNYHLQCPKKVQRASSRGRIPTNPGKKQLEKPGFG
jgi:hypothetical protein